MIIDHMSLSGKGAYLVDSRDTGNVNLARQPAPADSPWAGRSPVLKEGKVLEVSGIDLTIEAAPGQDLLWQLRRQEQPLISVQVAKEMFPGLYKDPYRHRVHTISGYEDFRRGSLTALRVMEVEGVPTLVSTGSANCSWKSGIYKMPEAMTIGAAAWDLAASKKTPDAGFGYDLILRYWQNADLPTEANVKEKFLIGVDRNNPYQGKPGNDRFKDFKDDQAGNPTKLTDVTAYQIEFGADVNYDAYLREFHAGPREAESLGRPLLRAVNILEEVAPAHDFFSLDELLLKASDYHLFEEPNGPSRRMRVSLDVTATLAADEDGNYEWLELTVHHGYAAMLEYVSARLNARVYLRPPMADSAER